MHANNSSNNPPRQSTSNNEQFSIATRTTILPMAGNLSDNSFLLPSVPYQQEDPKIDQPANLINVSSAELDQSKLSGHIMDSSNNLNQHEHNEKSATSATNPDGTKTEGGPNDGSENSSIPQDEVLKSKKRNKMSKKNGKLDARSKLEKSRQSARECRARKKLRYQYLEDLVCNREKAVVKLREELATVSSICFKC